MPTLRLHLPDAVRWATEPAPAARPAGDSQRPAGWRAAGSAWPRLLRRALLQTELEPERESARRVVRESATARPEASPLQALPERWN
jgi:hypothetical protein